MIEINLTNIFDDFYHTRFFVLLSLSIFSYLFALKLDQTLDCSYWLIFLPLWIWKLTAFAGMIIGSVSWCRLSRRRFENETFVQYKAMLISFSTNLFLFVFEIIACEKLETNSNMSWSVCFIPLFVLSLYSIGTCIWSIRHDRSYEIELFCSINLLQFLFVALRLDETIKWSWVLVLIPIWILMCIALVVLLYFVIVTLIILSRSSSGSNLQHNHYRVTQRWLNVIYYTAFVFSLLLFEIMLTRKLDQEMASADIMHHLQFLIQNPSPIYLASHHAAFRTSKNLFEQSERIVKQLSLEPDLFNRSFTSPILSHFFLKRNGSFSLREPSATSIPSSLASLSSSSSASSMESLDQPLSYLVTNLPLQVAYACLMLLSFNSRSGNPWWFGMRRDFCEIFLLLCPIFKTYGNVQMKLSCYENEEERRSAVNNSRRRRRRRRENRREANRNHHRSSSTTARVIHANLVSASNQVDLAASNTIENQASHETSMITINQLTTRNTGGSLSQQNQYAPSDMDELSNLEDADRLEVTSLSPVAIVIAPASSIETPVTATWSSNAEDRVRNDSDTANKSTSGGRLRFLNKKFHLNRKIKLKRLPKNEMPPSDVADDIQVASAIITNLSTSSPNETHLLSTVNISSPDDRQNNLLNQSSPSAGPIENNAPENIKTMPGDDNNNNIAIIDEVKSSSNGQTEKVERSKAIIVQLDLPD